MRQVEVVVIGAGLAGLAAARQLAAAGREIVALEAGDAPGGRVRTDRVDGLTLDRGFQVFLPSYPEARRALDLDRLDLRPFPAGLVVRNGSRTTVLADPRRHPLQLPATLAAPGSLASKLSFGWWAATVGLGPAHAVRRHPDRSLAAEMDRRRIDGPLRAVITRFLAGVLAEDEMSTSRRFGEFVIRSFVRGTPGLPAAGMQAIPEQLAAGLPDGVLQLNAPVHGLTGTTVDTAAGPIRADAVIVATDPRSAAQLLGRPEPAMKWFTTYYHRIPAPPSHAGWLHVDPARSGPLVNTVAVSAVAPTYADRGALVASTVLGRHDATLEPEVRRHASRMFGCSDRDWEFVTLYAVEALPMQPPGQPLQRAVLVHDGVYVAGDHRDTASIQGALVSGRRCAVALLAASG